MRKHQSVGEMISTCCFVGVSSICLFIASICWSLVRNLAWVWSVCWHQCVVGLAV